MDRYYTLRNHEALTLLALSSLSSHSSHSSPWDSHMGSPLSARPLIYKTSAPQLQPSCTRATIVVSKRRKELSVQALDVNGRVIFSK